MKHPVPKQKRSKSRTRRQYGQFATTVQRRLSNKANLTKCPQCGEKKLQHHVCTSCGTYNGRQVIKLETPTKKIKTVKA